MIQECFQKCTCNTVTFRLLDFRSGHVWIEERFQKSLLLREVDNPLADETGQFGSSTRTVTDDVEQKLLQTKVFENHSIGLGYEIRNVTF